MCANLHTTVYTEWPTNHHKDIFTLLASTAAVEQGLCYRMVTEAGKCEHALPTRLSQEICCCTVGKAWGSNCERCPQDGTGECAF